MVRFFAQFILLNDKSASTTLTMRYSDRDGTVLKEMESVENEAANNVYKELIEIIGDDLANPQELSKSTFAKMILKYNYPRLKEFYTWWLRGSKARRG